MGNLARKLARWISRILLFAGSVLLVNLLYKMVERYLPQAHLILGLILGMSILVACILVFPSYIVAKGSSASAKSIEPADLLKAKNDVRTTLIQGLAGALLLLGALATWRQVQATSQQLALSENQQRTERFTRAVDQLGNKTMNVRLGGIVGLGQILAIAPTEQERTDTLRVLTAYVRYNGAWSRASHKEYCYCDVDNLRNRTPDIQEALTIIGRENASISDNLLLDKVDLKGADLDDANLEAVYLADSHLEGALLRDADLDGADLRDASLNGSSLCGASLEDADLDGADLEDARADANTTWPAGYDWKSEGVELGNCD